VPVIADLYSSKHLIDLGGKPASVSIQGVTVETFQNDGDSVGKAVLHFNGNVIKPLVINKTNYLILSHAFGPNTDAWIGRQIIVSPSMTPFTGKMVETIRVEPLLNRAALSINGSAHQPPQDSFQHQATNGGTVPSSVPLNDEIPKDW
jgi:hypothetical protein